MNKEFYLHTLPQPFHLSVGAVLFDNDLRICVHSLDADAVPDSLKFLTGGLRHAYLLMRESLEVGETIVDAVHRGLAEEFSVEGTVEKYLGAIDCMVTTPTSTFQKTTLYHAVRLEKMNKRSVTDDPESRSTLEWYEPEKLVELLTTQEQLTNRPELHEVEIVKRFIEAYGA
jgi:ADP-ribose pyrophosphatase YjhB (NUDIX family)